MLFRSVFAANFVAHTTVATAAYFLFGGLNLFRAPRVAPVADDAAPLTGRQWFTLVILLAWIVGVVVFKVNPGLSAFAASALLIMARPKMPVSACNG